MARKKTTIAILMFSKNTDRSPVEKAQRRFIEEIEAAGYKAEVLYYNLFSVFFSQGKLEIYYNNKKIKANQYKFILVQYYFLNIEFTSNMFVVEALDKLGVKTFNSLPSVLLAKNKRESLFKLALNNIPIIPTGINFSQFFLDQQLNHFGDKKIIAKANNGSMGYGVSILDSKISFISFMEFIGQKMQPSNILIQPFINSNNEDYRLFVVGNQVVATMKRKALGIEFRANVSKGGQGKMVQPTKKMKVLAMRAVKTLGLDYAGVDLVKDQKGRLYVVEVNSNPGLKIEHATGVNIVKQIVSHCIEKTEK